MRPNWPRSASTPSASGRSRWSTATSSTSARSIPATGIPPKRDRSLKVEIWYPAQAVAGATPVTYEDAMESEPPAPPARFTIQGLAVRDAKPTAAAFRS